MHLFKPLFWKDCYNLKITFPKDDHSFSQWMDDHSFEQTYIHLAKGSVIFYRKSTLINGPRTNLQGGSIEMLFVLKKLELLWIIYDFHTAFLRRKVWFPMKSEQRLHLHLLQYYCFRRKYMLPIINLVSSNARGQFNHQRINLSSVDY